MEEEQILMNKDGHIFVEHQHRMAIIEEQAVMNLFNTLKPKFGKDGNEWFVLYGDDLQSGICGFGKTLSSAIQDFNNQFNKEL